VQEGFAARLLRKTPDVDLKLLNEFKLFVSDQVTKLPQVDPSKVDFKKWLDSRSSYNEERKKQIQEAYDSLLGGKPNKKGRHHIASFVKSEYYPEYKYARMINSRPDVFKAWAGPWISACEDIVYHEFPEFIKHTPVSERPSAVRKLRLDGRRYYQTDFTAFESHFTPEVQYACENLLLSWLLGKWHDRNTVLNANSGVNIMKTRMGVGARRKGGRMSGDLWTSLGNGFTNLMLAKFLAYKQGKELYGFVEGDDGLFSTEADLNVQLYEQLGFTIKIDEVDDPCKASFCGMIFSDSGEIIRDPYRFMAGFGWTQSFIDAGPRIMDELLHAKCLSALCETPQCPIVGSLVRCALKRVSYTSPRFVDDGYHTYAPGPLTPFSPSSDTRQLFSELFNVTPELQLQVENEIENDHLDRVMELLSPCRRRPGTLATPVRDALDDQRDYSLRYLVIV
jgi:hypothetical protein